MDDIVRQAMAKWPNVPHCYGWLALDARGVWRMRDERVQALGLRGDPLTRAVLVDFINRNYACDERGCWYFQNGPQRVYVDLEALPFAVRSDPAREYVLHTGEALGPVEAAWLTESGELILQAAGKAAQLDDRDMASCIPRFRRNGAPVSDDALLAWAGGEDRNSLHLLTGAGEVALERITRAELPQRFGFVARPRS